MFAARVPVWDTLTCCRNGTPGGDLDAHKGAACLSLPAEMPKEALLSCEVEKHTKYVISNLSEINTSRRRPNGKINGMTHRSNIGLMTRKQMAMGIVAQRSGSLGKTLPS